MSRTVVLDAGVLSDVVRPVRHEAGRRCRAWLESVVAAGGVFRVPEIADNEVRRELLRAEKTASVRRLDALVGSRPGVLLPITTPVMRRAATLWAEARRRGLPTAEAAAIDADVILAAQYLVQIAPTLPDPAEGVVATANVRHVARMVPAARWDQVTS